MLLDKEIDQRSIRIFELVLIIGTAIFPLLISLPYRVNIFLTWEGAYRLYLGQVPYKDFGMPLGYGFFILPYVFFKIFGPYLFSLVIAQSFINIITLLTFSNLLKIFGLTPAQRLLSVFVFILSFTFQNFWPWYNQSVFVFQMIGFNFLLIAMNTPQKKLSYGYVFLSTVFIFWAFFTKQDSGGIAIVFGLILLAYHTWRTKTYHLILAYVVFLGLIGLMVIGPVIKYDFGYWFNYGQPPHSSRLKMIDFLNKIIGGSNWEKLYIGIVFFIFIKKAEDFKKFIYNERAVLFLLITIGVILQSLVIKITSPLPTDHQSYFHGFAFAFIIGNMGNLIEWQKLKYLSLGLFMIFFWWSALYWDYFSRIFSFPPSQPQEVIAKVKPLSPWVNSDFRAFRKIKMPLSTVEGINFIKSLPEISGKKDLKVLNMSEITPLAHELSYEPLKNQPLWYHLDIGMFRKEVDEFCVKIRNQEYDIILYQDIPVLPTFYPQEIKPCLSDAYKLVHTFEAPRKRTEGDSYIFVYLRKK